MARPRFQPSPEDRHKVQGMAAFGIPEDQIARFVGPRGISPKTLRKHFPRELSMGMTTANTQVAQTLYQMATSGECPAATIFWMKTRVHWTERERPVPASGSVIEELSDADIEKAIADELGRVAAAGEAEAVSETIYPSPAKGTSS